VGDVFKALADPTRRLEQALEEWEKAIAEYNPG
jgi:hypothetical protein